MYVCVSVKIEMYVYEIGPRYFYHATTSPEMWTHVFELSSLVYFVVFLFSQIANNPSERILVSFFPTSSEIISLQFNFFYYIILKDG